MQDEILNILDLCEVLKISDIEAKKLMKRLNAKMIFGRYFITRKMLTDYIENDAILKNDKGFLPPNL
ncbi:MAG: hypothetical protein PVJ67_05080 [Candidatus Pacearchaeota archaeon]|jgi:hypothetical protein